MLTITAYSRISRALDGTNDLLSVPIWHIGIWDLMNFRRPVRVKLLERNTIVKIGEAKNVN